MRENRTSGSVRGALGNRRSYREMKHWSNQHRMTEFKRIETVGIPIIYSLEHSDVATAMAEAVEKTVSVAARYWNLSVPKGCEVHVLTNCEEFIYQTVPKEEE